MSSKSRANDGTIRIGLIVISLSLLFMAVGFFVAINYGNIGDRNSKAKVQYVSFGDVSIASAAGRLVISFDLEVEPARMAAVSKEKARLETRFKTALTALDPNSFYSRAGKEWLASHLRMVANRELGSELIEAVYFGDFKIFGTRPASSLTSS